MFAFSDTIALALTSCLPWLSISSQLTSPAFSLTLATELLPSKPPDNIHHCLRHAQHRYVISCNSLDLKLCALLVKVVALRKFRAHTVVVFANDIQCPERPIVRNVCTGGVQRFEALREELRSPVVCGGCVK
jgi:hypothetical protein